MLVLPEKLRGEVRKPFGRVMGGEALLDACRRAQKPLVAVGDQCGFDLIKAGIAPDMLIFDFKIRRVEVGREIKEVFAAHARNPYVVLSPPGAITEELEDAVLRLLADGKGAIFVVGEDDLSALLVMAHSKGGTLVYGQPGEGAVLVRLGGDEVRRKAQGFISMMEKAD